MPSVVYPSVLRAVYEEASRAIAARNQVPTDLLLNDPDIYRSFPLKYITITADGVIPKDEANQAALVIRDEGLDTNRFSGQSLSAGVPASGGLYCTFGQPALIAEVLHYSRANKDGTINQAIARDSKTGFPRPSKALAEKCIVRIRLMSSFLALDLTTHNSGAQMFVGEIERSRAVQSAIHLAHAPSKPLWDWIFDGWDYTIARGIGLAVASSDYLSALRVGSARHADRSENETGDNLIFFGRNGSQVPNLYISEAYLIQAHGQPVRYPVEFVPASGKP
jgi:hypothetical protein